MITLLLTASITVILDIAKINFIWLEGDVLLSEDYEHLNLQGHVPVSQEVLANHSAILESMSPCWDIQTGPFVSGMLYSQWLCIANFWDGNVSLLV